MSNWKNRTFDSLLRNVVRKREAKRRMVSWPAAAGRNTLLSTQVDPQLFGLETKGRLWGGASFIWNINVRKEAPFGLKFNGTRYPSPK